MVANGVAFGNLLPALASRSRRGNRLSIGSSTGIMSVFCTAKTIEDRVSKPGTVNTNTFQGLIFALQEFWAKQGCVILQPLDMQVGAGTFHWGTFLTGDWAGELELGLRPAQPPPHGRPLW